MTKQFTAIIEREGDGYVALCPELDIASQGDSIEEARVNLAEALELFLETASSEEIDERLREEVSRSTRAPRDIKKLRSACAGWCRRILRSIGKANGYAAWGQTRRSDPITISPSPTYRAGRPCG